MPRFNKYTYEVKTMIVKKPPMGWNTWNTFGHNISEQIVKESTDAFVALGLKDYGYEYIVIDDLILHGDDIRKRANRPTADKSHRR